jgi:hypothetical protein
MTDRPAREVPLILLDRIDAARDLSSERITPDRHGTFYAACSPTRVGWSSTLIHAAERWRGLRFTEFELRQLAAVKKELDAGCLRRR